MRLLINGQPRGFIDHWLPAWDGPNGYLRIDGDDDAAIYSMMLDVDYGGPGGEGVCIDRLAFAPCATQPNSASREPVLLPSNPTTSRNPDSFSIVPFPAARPSNASNALVRRDLAGALDALGRVHLALAGRDNPSAPSASRASEGAKIRHLQDARSAFTRASEILTELHRSGRLAPIDAPLLERPRSALTECEAALKGG
jgi:hypothetical protein